MQVNSPGWRIRSATRGARGAGSDLPGLRPDFLTDVSRVAEEAIVEPAPATRGQPGGSAVLDLTTDVEPGQTAILAIRHASKALTFHLPVQSTTRGVRGPSQARFQVTLRRTAATRGIGSQAVKAILVKAARLGGDKLISLALSKLVAAFEKQSWKKQGLREGWLQVTKPALAAGSLAHARPVSPERSLLLIHGTFSNAAAAFGPLASSDFFERVKETYADRIFAFNHFSLSRTPDENVRLLLEGLPEQTTTFDVITHSRGGLVLRTLVERAKEFGALAKRFKLGTAVLVASPNEGTPLATPSRWDETVGLLANILEILPDNPLTTGAEFVANGLVWLANHASGDIPGLHAMDGDGDPIKTIQEPPGPPANAYSALVANYSPTDDVLRRLVDAGLDQFFGSANDLVVPSEGGWRIDASAGGHIPASRIGCFGPGGNLADGSVTHVGFFSRTETVTFLVNALHGHQQPLSRIDPRKPLPDRRLVRGEAAGARGAAPAVSGAPAAARRPGAKARPEPGALRVSITNGDLMFEPRALLLGHYTATRLTGTEDIMNRLIGGAMDRSLHAGVYPLTVGTHEIFINSQADTRGFVIPRPAAVIVVGLGAEGRLKPGDLVKTVRLAVIGWARRLTEPGATRPQRGSFELASTLIGSGGTGITAGQAARLIAQGVWEANATLHDEGVARSAGADKPWPRCSHLRLIELYLDRATEAWNALTLQQAVTPESFKLDEVIHAGTGALQRPADSGYRGADYDFITVETKVGERGDATLEYTLDTRRARSEIRAQRAQGELIEHIVGEASNELNRDERIGRSLFNLLIPVELEAFLGDSGEMQMSLNLQTASIPWELLDTARGSTLSNQLPWAIRVKLLRKLRLAEFREQVVDAGTDESVLIIGEPLCPPEFARLEGARTEAIGVHSRLTGPDGLAEERVKLLAAHDASQPGPDADQIINTMFERPWRIVHIAGHGDLAARGKSGGVVLSNGTFLGPAEIRSMRVVPELVFINCCHLGRADDKALLKRYDRTRFASGVAGALIDIGVRCVVAAGWAVDDDAAGEFASAFYASLLRGNRFINAVGDARLAAYQIAPGVNTWAAYQCYGDAEWRLSTTRPQADTVDDTPRDLPRVASAAALQLELDRIVVQTRAQGFDPLAQVKKLGALEELLRQPPERARWIASGAVAEKFGEAYAEAGALESATDWYTRAVNARDARASTKASEQLANVQGRLAWDMVDKALRHRDELGRQQEAAATPAARKAAKAARKDAQRKLDEAIVIARSRIQQALSLLDDLIRPQSTVERESLVGSALKRRALVNQAAGHTGRVRRDLTEMRSAYKRSLQVGTTEGADVFYPAMNCLAAEVALGTSRNARVPLDARVVRIVEKRIASTSDAEADFWSVVGSIELEQYKAISARRLASSRPHLERQYRNLYQRAKAPRMWSSVYDNAMLVLGSHARRGGSPKEERAAGELLGMLRAFAHPTEKSTVNS